MVRIATRQTLPQLSPFAPALLALALLTAAPPSFARASALPTPLSAEASPQQQDQLFAGSERFAAGAKESTEVNLDKNMLSLAGGMTGISADVMKKMDFVVVRSYEYAQPGKYRMADVEAFSKRLEGDGWSHLVKERSATETTDVCVKSDREGQMVELVVIDAEPTEVNFVHLKGHLTMAELMKVGQQYGLPAGAAPAADAAGTSPKLKGR